MSETASFQRARKPEEIEARRATLLRAAAELFDAEGPMGAGLNAIAAKAGFTKSNVYRYFESREQVLLALFHDEMDVMVPEVCAQLAATDVGDVERLGRVLAWAFAHRPRLTQLSAILTGVLEANVSEESIIHAKRRMRELTFRLAAALARKLPGATAEDCLWAFLMIGTLAAGMSPSTRPSPVAAAVLARAEFAMFRPDMQRDLERAAKALLTSISAA